MEFTGGVLQAAWEVARESAVFILFGFLAAGFIKSFVPADRITKYLKPKKARSVIYSALVGIPLPLCSCGVLPTATALRKQGASKGATTSFLISTPESGVDSIAITYALMDPVMTIFRPLAAFFTATFAGLLELSLGEPDDEADKNFCNECGKEMMADYCEDCAFDPLPTRTFTGKIKSGVLYAANNLMDDMAKWLAIGFIAAGLITALLPDDFFSYYSDSVFLSMLAMLVIGMPLYICATSSTPVAAALILKGLNPGAVLVFLLAGPATNAASLAVLYKLLGKRSLAIYLAAIAIGSITLGYALNFVYAALGLAPQALAGGEAQTIPAVIEIVSAILLFALMGRSLLKEAMKKPFL